MKIVHISDPHLPAPGQTLWGLDPYARLEACLADVEALHADADFCVISGDLSDSGDAGAYAWLAERLARFPLETVLMAGNHDDRAAMRAHLPAVMQDDGGFVQGRRETAEGVFLFLDTLKGATSAGQYCPARQAWLAAELDRAGDRPVRIFMHHPPFDVGIPFMDRIKLDEAEEFGRIVAGRAIRHIFFGHIHRPCFVSWQGIPCNALPGTSHQVPLSREHVGTAYSVEPAMIGIVLIEGERTVVHLDACLDRAPALMER